MKLRELQVCQPQYRRTRLIFDGRQGLVASREYLASLCGNDFVLDRH